MENTVQTLRRVKESYPRIEKAMSKDHSFQVFLGFDGFIDVISRAIRRICPDGSEEYFDHMQELADFIRSRAGKSCGIQLRTLQRKVGGNSPLMGFSLNRLGVPIHLVGALGYPQIDSLFLDMLHREDCAHSVGAADVGTAIEFHDGKVLIGASDTMRGLGWEEIKKRVGLEELVHLFSVCKVIALLNWSETVRCNEIWQGLLCDVMPQVKPPKEALLCLDLTDFARRSVDEVEMMLRLVGEFGKYYKVVLSLNESEHDLLYETVFGQAPAGEEAPKLLAKRLELDIFCVHLHTGAVAVQDGEVYTCDNYFVEQPRLLTGGGDNFNGGLMYALALELDLPDALVVANAVSSYYVRNAASPGKKALLEYILEWGTLER